MKKDCIGKISVIVPIYNSEKTLKRTLDSIINQTYDNLEIILVNDGSTDNSLQICNDYMKRDNRITILNQENSGVGEARNKGIENATGEFISFVDSDDVLDEDFYMTLYKTSLDTNAQIVESGAKVILGENDFIYPYEKSEKIAVCDNFEYMKHYLDFSFNVSVWGKIYRRDLIGDTRFPKLNINEDFIFLWEIVKKTEKFCENLNVNYHYYLDKDESLSKTQFGHNHMSMLDHLNKVIEDTKRIHPELIDEALNHYSACLLHTLVLYCQYISGDNIEDYMIEDGVELLKAVKKMIPIKSYLLLHESQYSVEDLVNQIKSKTKVISK